MFRGRMHLFARRNCRIIFIGVARAWRTHRQKKTGGWCGNARPGGRPYNDQVGEPSASKCYLRSHGVGIVEARLPALPMSCRCSRGAQEVATTYNHYAESAPTKRVQLIGWPVAPTDPQPFGLMDLKVTSLRRHSSSIGQQLGHHVVLRDWPGLAGRQPVTRDERLLELPPEVW